MGVPAPLPQVALSRYSPLVRGPLSTFFCHGLPVAGTVSAFFSFASP